MWAILSSPLSRSNSNEVVTRRFSTKVKTSVSRWIFCTGSMPALNNQHHFMRLQNQHGIPEGVEAVPLGDGLLVGLQHQLSSGEGRNQHQEG